MNLKQYENQYGSTPLNASDYKEEQYDLIPDGQYEAIVTKTEVKQTKDMLGIYISLQFKIVDQKCNGRVIFGNLNYINQNADAQRIGRQQLAILMRDRNIAVLNDSDDLLNAHALLTINSREYEGEKQNNIKNIKPSKANQMPSQNVPNMMGGVPYPYYGQQTPQQMPPQTPQQQYVPQAQEPQQPQPQQYPPQQQAPAKPW